VYEFIILASQVPIRGGVKASLPEVPVPSGKRGISKSDGSSLQDADVNEVWGSSWQCPHMGRRILGSKGQLWEKGIFLFIYLFIYMCIQCLGHFSPLTPLDTQQKLFCPYF
jgi:hypothetical protein